MVKNFTKEYEEILEGRRLWCRGCEKEMGQMEIGGGLWDLGGGRLYHCDNEKCDRYGDLTIVGIKVKGKKRK